MTTWNPRANDLFLQALALRSAGERQQYLDGACAQDAALRAEVEALLEASARAGSFLEAPAAAPHPVATVDEPLTERPGTVIGPYKLLEQIGEGGFGVVFLAEQTQPLRRKVALKILKPGMDTRQVVARFEAERQALALMEHANIAQVFDGGATASGRPYFVMELVKGLPITAYCDRAQLTPRERLALFVQVCQAVQHAHQKGIIHRDLKPSNVLVTVQDTTPVVKVIDFGVAKALGQELTDKTLFTGFAQMVGTPLYMSPEQAGQSGLDIDTRSDVYSLGVLLYELLTGTTPFGEERLKDLGYEELRRVIREEEPQKPSTRISTLAQAAATVATQRKSDPKRLSQLFRGELDWIVMKALEKDRSRRYESASAFAADVQRYLTDEPVQACPPSAWYRLRKFTRRNKTGLVLAGLLLCGIASLGVGVGWAVRDRAARQARAANDLELTLDRAELFQEQGKRAEALAMIERAELLAAEAAPDLARDERLAAVQERFAAEARDQKLIARFEEILLRVESEVDVEQSRFTKELAFPEIRDALRHYGIVIGDMAPAEAAARVQDRPESIRRNLVAALEECLRWVPKAEASTRQWLLAALTAADTDTWRVRARKAWVAGDRAALEQVVGDADLQKQQPSFLLLVARALPEEMRATRLELVRRIQRVYPADLWANHSLAYELMTSGQPKEAIRYFTAALALRPDNPGIYLNRGNALRAAAEVDAAIADYRQSLALAPQYAVAHCSLGYALMVQGQRAEAIAELREALRLDKDYPQAHCNLGAALHLEGRLDEAMGAHREALRLKPDYPEAHFSLGNVLLLKGQREEGIAEFREAIRLKNDYPEAHFGLGTALDDNGQLDDAMGQYREALRFKRDYPNAHYNLGLALHGKGRLDEAIAEYREALRFKPDYAQAHCNLGLVLLAQGDFRQALVELRRGNELGTKEPRWRYPSAQWVRQCKRLVELDERLPGLLEGATTPASAAERIELAGLCSLKRLHRAAARFYAEAFAAQPKLGDDLDGRLSLAARAAALAGCGQGKDADKLEDTERARLRHQALDWLRAELAAWSRLLDRGPDKAGSADGVARGLRHWLASADLAGVRGPEALAKLPETERQPWQQLWDDVAGMLARAQVKTTPAKKADAK